MQQIIDVIAVYRAAEKAAPTTTYSNGLKAISFTVNQRKDIVEKLLTAAQMSYHRNLEQTVNSLVSGLVDQDEKAGENRLRSYQRHNSRLTTILAQLRNGKFRGCEYGDVPQARPVPSVVTKSFTQLRDKASAFTPVELVKRGLAMGVTNVDTYLELQRPVFDSLLQEARKDSYAESLQADILKTLQNSPYTGKIDKARIQSVMVKALSQLG